MLEILQNYINLHPYVGLIIVFIGIIITNIFPVMIFVYPDIFIFLGLFLAVKFFPWYVVWVVLVFGAFIWEIISYFIWSNFWNKILKFKFFQNQKIIEWIANMKNNSGKYFLIWKLIPGVVRVAPVVAWIIKMEIKKFLLLDFIMIIYGITYFFVVWLIGFNMLQHFLGDYVWYVVSFIILAYIFWEYYKRRIKKDL